MASLPKGSTTAPTLKEDCSWSGPYQRNRHSWQSYRNDKMELSKFPVFISQILLLLYSSCGPLINKWCLCIAMGESVICPQHGIVWQASLKTQYLINTGVSQIPKSNLLSDTYVKWIVQIIIIYYYTKGKVVIEQMLSGWHYTVLEY